MYIINIIYYLLEIHFHHFRAFKTIITSHIKYTLLNQLLENPPCVREKYRLRSLYEEISYKKSWYSNPL